MKMTKFHELCTAFGKAQGRFETFQNDCHLIAIELVKELKGYFEIPDSQFALYKINEQNEFNLVPPALINALTLRPDSLWQFGVGLTLCSAPETLPQELILIHILIRKDLNDNFFLRYGKVAKEIELTKGEKYNFVPFFDFLHENIIKTYDEQMQQFIGQDTRRKIGYNQ